MEIKVKRKEINQSANKLINSSEELKKEKESVRTILGSINEVWNGLDAIKYIEVLESKYVIELEILCDCIENYGNYLKNIPDDYTKIDELYASKKINV